MTRLEWENRYHSIIPIPFIMEYYKKEYVGRDDGIILKILDEMFKGIREEALSINRTKQK